MPLWVGQKLTKQSIFNTNQNLKNAAGAVNPVRNDISVENYHQNVEQAISSPRLKLKSNQTTTLVFNSSSDLRTESHLICTLFA